VRYADHALLTSMAKDEVLIASLREIYLTPLEAGRDGGAADRATLCAYFAAGRNGKSAAAALSTSRQTVSNRLKSVEKKIGRSLLACATDLELTLRLADHGLI
jgi:DNA-binding PucR family transcriptional regulator